MKVAVLWTALSGYMNACLKELAAQDDVQLFVSHKVPDGTAPFDEAQFSWIQNRYTWKNDVETNTLRSKLKSFGPEILVFAGWHIPSYREIARAHAKVCWRVMTMDNPWRGTLRQWAGCAMSPFFIRPIADAVWLPGERQAVFAKKLGFKTGEILRGVYSCDAPFFETVYLDRTSEGKALPRSFLFVGRFVAAKGIRTLARAYGLYREKSSAPWPLVCCGAGPLQCVLEGQPGIEVAGFIQPEDMVKRFKSGGCLVLPSAFEPWALVVHEAASAGLLVLASDQVGAAVHLVQPDYNGYIFERDDFHGLAELMMKISNMSDERICEMSEASHMMSLQYSPKRWATTLIGSHNPRG